jgi:hypothetical protein
VRIEGSDLKRHGQEGERKLESRQKPINLMVVP